MAKLHHEYAPASLTLAMNAAEGQLQLVLAEGARPLCLQTWDAPVRGTEILAPALRHMLTGLALQPQHIGRIACVRGPGSFTGIRLLLATAAALRRVINAKVAGLDYMQLLALGAGRRHPAPQAGQHVWVLTHARRGLVHAQPFRWLGEGTPPQAVAAVALISPAEACARMTQEVSTLPALVLGSGLERNAEALQAGYPQLVRAPEALNIPACHDLLTLTNSLDEAQWTEEDIEPLYVRPCDAVDNLPQLALRQGLTPEQAAAELERMLQAAPASLL